MPLEDLEQSPEIADYESIERRWGVMQTANLKAIGAIVSGAGPGSQLWYCDGYCCIEATIAT
jgi:hypothetical protein